MLRIIIQVQKNTDNDEDFGVGLDGNYDELMAGFAYAIRAFLSQVEKNGNSGDGKIFFQILNELIVEDNDLDL